MRTYKWIQKDPFDMNLYVKVVEKGEILIVILWNDYDMPLGEKNCRIEVELDKNH